MGLGIFLKFLIVAIALLIYIYLVFRFGSWGIFMSKKQFESLEKEENNGNTKSEG